MAHRWHFFRAGGVDQVSLRNGDDLLALKELDQKLWVALAMPVHGVDIDPTTLEMIDKDNDNRVRVVDVLETIEWADKTFKNVGDLLTSADSVKLSQIKDEAVLAAAKRILGDLGKADATSISVSDATEVTKVFVNTVLNGDGIIIPESTDDADLKKLIEDIIATVGSVTDRSEKPGVDKKHADEFFAAIDARTAWMTKGKDPALAPLGDATPAAYDAYAAVRDKLDDYFTRCRIAGYDPRGAAALASQDAELTSLSTKSLSAADADLAKLPLAKIDPAARLSLDTGINPAWATKLATFGTAAVTPILGARALLSPTDVAQIADKLAAYATWRADQPTTKVDALDTAWAEKLATSDLRKKLDALIEQDASHGAEYDQITAVVKAVRLQRDFARIVRSFVNFSDFYSRQDGTFQAGTLYLDSRALHLTVSVEDVAKHATLAASSDSYLIYCDIQRNGVTKHIAAAVTNGDADNLFVGRNGVFYDRDDNDWDATITKIIANPISIREAFWMPYKKLAKTIEETVSKRATEAEASSSAKLTDLGTTVAHADKAATPTAPGAPVAPPKKIDLGTVAAIGVAIGGIGTLVGALLGSLFGLGKWLPLGLLAILLLISGPSMLLAYLKLRRRNIGPILDANNWAINGRARVNVAFGAAMTQLAKLPPNSHRTLDDPFADKRTPWKLWAFLIVLLILGGTWFVGKLDKYLPNSIRSTEVLGEYAPAAVKAKAEMPAAPAAPAPEPPPAEGAPAN